MIDKDSQVVVAGDFNKVEMKKSEFLENEFLLKPAISSDKSTHKSGGHLDNFWTNIDTSQAHFIENLDSLSDHALFIITSTLEVKSNVAYPTKTKLSI